MKSKWDPTQELKDMLAWVRENHPNPDPDEEVEEAAPAPALAPKRRRTATKKKRAKDSAIMTADEVAEVLGISKRQVQKLEKARAFPIPRLPQVSRTPTYSRELVMSYARGELKLPASNAKGRRSQ